MAGLGKEDNFSTSRSLVTLSSRQLGSTACCSAWSGEPEALLARSRHGSGRAGAGNTPHRPCCLGGSRLCRRAARRLARAAAPKRGAEARRPRLHGIGARAHRTARAPSGGSAWLAAGYAVGAAAVRVRSWLGRWALDLGL